MSGTRERSPRAPDIAATGLRSKVIQWHLSPFFGNFNSLLVLDISRYFSLFIATSRRPVPFLIASKRSPLFIAAPRDFAPFSVTPSHSSPLLAASRRFPLFIVAPRHSAPLFIAPRDFPAFSVLLLPLAIPRVVPRKFALARNGKSGPFES